MLLYINLLAKLFYTWKLLVVYGRFDKKFDMCNSWSLNMWVFKISKLITKHVSIYPNSITKYVKMAAVIGDSDNFTTQNEWIL